MANLTIPVVKDALKQLRADKAELERKIRGLEEFLGGQPAAGLSAVRGATDIRPAVREVFQENGNQPMQLRDLTEAIAQKHPEIEKEVITKKMFNVIRTILDKSGYGKYRLKEAV